MVPRRMVATTATALGDRNIVTSDLGLGSRGHGAVGSWRGKRRVAPRHRQGAVAGAWLVGRCNSDVGRQRIEQLEGVADQPVQ